jgi:hypothetical protein
MTESEYLIRGLINLTSYAVEHHGALPPKDDVRLLLNQVEDWLLNHNHPRRRRKAFEVIQGGKAAVNPATSIPDKQINQGNGQ